MRKRSIIWAGLAGILAVIVVGSSAAATGKFGSAQKAGVFRLAIGAEPPSLDPGLATDTTSASILLNIYDPLIKLGPGPALKAEPAAAQSWTVKGSTVTLNLRRDVRWTNGQPTTAKDYVYGWLRTIAPELGADYAYQFFGIKGAEAYNSCDPKKANCTALRSKVGIKAIGNYKLQIQLTSPQPWFIQQLSHHSFLPTYKAAVDKYGAKYTEPNNIVTNGPFRLTSWKHDASLTAVKNTKWRGAASVKLSRIEMPIIVDGATMANAFDAGNIDASSAGSTPPELIPKYQKTPFWHVFPALGTYYYGFNVKNITDVNQRRAMAYAIDRQAIIKFITRAGQVPAKGFTPRGIAGGPTITKNSTMPSIHQTDQAKSFLSKVASPKKSINLYLNNAPGHVNIATAIQSYWQKDLGLNVTIKRQEWAQYLEFLGPPPNSDVDVYRLGWIYDFPDAYNGLSLWTCKSGNNNTNWCNSKFDNLVNQATKTPNFDKRVALYQQAENILTGPQGDLPIMPIYWYTFTHLTKNNVKGFFTAPQGTYDLTTVTVS
jgi:oligopeptide transport system substrate-binding protein